MDEKTRELEGSPLRDKFKRIHKDLDRGLWACDVDFALVGKYSGGAGIVAILDCKKPKEAITFAEVVAYNDFLDKGLQVFIVRVVLGSNEGISVDGKLAIYRYLGGNWRSDPVTYRLDLIGYCGSWAEFESWEEKLRAEWARSQNEMHGGRAG